MAKRKTKRKKAYKPKNHLASHESFRFALNIAVLSTLMVVILYMVGNMGASRDTRTKAAPVQNYDNSR